MSYNGIICWGEGPGLFDCCMHKELPSTETMEELVKYIECMYDVKRADIKRNCHDELTFDRMEEHYWDSGVSPTKVHMRYKIAVWRTERVRGKELEDALK